MDEVKPTVGYTDYILRSTAPSASTGWRYNIMKFAALGERTVDPSSSAFLKPVKLNRKDPRTVRRLTEEEREKINKRDLGVDMDVDEVKEEDVKPGFVKKEREEIDLTLVGTGSSGIAAVARSKGSMFKKKTKRVFVSSEEARRLKREEWMPWVLEGEDGDERWIGRLEGGTGESASGAKSALDTGLAQADRNGTGMKGWRPPAAASEAGGGGSSYVAFVFGANGDDFNVVPASRWYKFSRGPRHATLGGDEAEDEYNRLQKSQDPERWMMHRRPGGSASTTPGSSATASSSSKGKRPAVPVAASNIRSRLLDKSTSSARASVIHVPGKLRSVISGTAGDYGDDEMRGRKVKREGGMDQDDDEFDYEEDFQDDEEGIAKIDDMADEQEVKELEERIKKEMRAANGYDAAPVDDDGDEEIEALTNTGKEAKKLLKKREKNRAYESDEDSSDDDDDASVASVDADAAARQSTSTTESRRASHGHTKGSSSSRRSSHTPRPSGSASHSGSRNGSPAPGHASSVLARRATSPNPSSSGRQSTPGSRSGSPAPGGGKRKRLEGEEGDASKRRNNGTPPPARADGLGDADLITEAMLVELFRTKPSFSTKEVLSHFKKALKADPRNKASIGQMLQSVANLVDGNLVLKTGY